jgi:DNA-binding NarL/FixJ family response regulator
MSDASAPKIRVLIVDDHELVRAGLRTLLSTDPQIEVIGEAAAGAQAVALAREHQPDVVLLRSIIRVDSADAGPARSP